MRLLWYMSIYKSALSAFACQHFFLLFCTRKFLCSKNVRTEPVELSLSTDSKLQIHFTWLMMIYGVVIVVIGGGGIVVKIKAYKRRKTWKKNHAWAVWRYGVLNSATTANKKKTNNNMKKNLLMDEKSICSRDNDMLLFAVFAEKCGRKRSSAKREKAGKRHTQQPAKEKYESRTCKQNKTKLNWTKLNGTKTNTC